MSLRPIECSVWKSLERFLVSLKLLTMMTRWDLACSDEINEIFVELFSRVRRVGVLLSKHRPLLFEDGE